MPVIIAQMLLCAASALFLDAPAVGAVLGHAACTVMCAVLMRRQAMTVKHQKSMSALEMLLWIAASCVLCVLSTYALNATGLADADGAYESSEAVIEGASSLVRCILVIIAAPISEELLYRGILYERTAQCFGELAGIAASVLAFALSHGNMVQAIAACASGALFTAAYRRSRTVILPVVMHSAFNACSMFAAPVLFRFF